MRVTQLLNFLLARIRSKDLWERYGRTWMMRPLSARPQEDCLATFRLGIGGYSIGGYSMIMDEKWDFLKTRVFQYFGWKSGPQFAAVAAAFAVVVAFAAAVYVVDNVVYDVAVDVVEDDAAADKPAENHRKI